MPRKGTVAMVMKAVFKISTQALMMMMMAELFNTIMGEAFKGNDDATKVGRKDNGMLFIMFRCSSVTMRRKRRRRSGSGRLKRRRKKRRKKERRVGKINNNEEKEEGKKRRRRRKRKIENIREWS